MEVTGISRTRFSAETSRKYARATRIAVQGPESHRAVSIGAV
jgi:hypothetical protein